jgi:hypothetical protein
MAQRIVINELRAWNRRAKENGKVAKVVADVSNYSGELWYIPACAYNPRTGKTVFLVIMKSQREQTQ